jgi:hypothetical protein
MYGNDKTTLDELTKTVTELEKLKIEIIEKKGKTSELNNATEKMENQIKKVDEDLLNNTYLDTTSNETLAENEQNINEEKTIDAQDKITISKDSNINILIDNINTLVDSVNEQVNAETERKAEEERKAKEEAEKKELEEEIAKFSGTYLLVNSIDNNEYTLKEDGTFINPWGKTDKPISISKKEDGSIWVLTERYYDNDIDCEFEIGYYLYPIGVGNRENKNKLGLLYCNGMSADEYEKK